MLEPLGAEASVSFSRPPRRAAWMSLSAVSSALAFSSERPPSPPRTAAPATDCFSTDDASATLTLVTSDRTCSRRSIVSSRWDS